MKKKQSIARGGLRPAVIVLVAIAFLAFALPASADPPEISHVLPFANTAAPAGFAHGYRTSLRAVNPSEQVIYFEVYGKVGPAYAIGIAPQTTLDIPSWPAPGVNVREVAADSRLVIYVEIETPLGTITRVAGLAPVTSATYYDLPPTGTFESWVFVGLADDTSGWVSVGSQGQELDDGGAVLWPVEAGRAEVRLGYSLVAPSLPGPPAVYTFAIVVHDSTGAITVQAPAAVTPYVPPEPEVSP